MAMTHTTLKIDGLRANCTLVAVREVTGADDQAIIQKFLPKGWVPGKGAHERVYTQVIRELGFQLEEVSTQVPGVEAYTLKTHKCWWGSREVYTRNPAAFLSVGQFCKTFNEGVYVVHNRVHAFVIRDGRVVDPNFGMKQNLRRRVVHAVRVLNPSPSRHLKPIVPLARGEDPWVGFVGPSTRNKTSKSGRIEARARQFCYINAATLGGRGKHPDYPILPMLRLSDLIRYVPEYTRSFAAADIKAGAMVKA